MENHHLSESQENLGIPHITENRLVSVNEGNLGSLGIVPALNIVR
jgi:hypothetical protein